MRLFSLVSCLLFVASLAVAQPATVSTIAGIPGVAGYWDGPRTDALFMHPTWLDVGLDTPAQYSCENQLSGFIYVVDRINQRLRRIAPNGDVTTIPISTRVPISNLNVNFGSAFGGGIVVEPPGSGCGCGVYARGIFIASSGTNQLMLVSQDGQLAARDDWYPIMGTGTAGSADGTETTAQFNTPIGIARSPLYGQDRLGSGIYNNWALYVADSGNHTIRRIGYTLSGEACPQPRNFRTLAGSPGQPGSADGRGSAARFNYPRGIAAAVDGSVYVTDAGNHTIRRITADGTVTTVAGEAGVAGSNDGPALQAHLNTPSGIDVDANGNVFVVDTFNHTIRELKNGQLITVAGQTGVSGFADGDASSAKFNAPVGLKIAPDGSLIVADTGNNAIRRVLLQH